MTFGLENFYPLTDRLSKKIARDFPPVEADDICQEMLVVLIQKWDQFSTAQVDNLENYVATALDRVGREHAAKERNRGLVIDDRYYYTPDFVREILSVFFDRADWESCPRTEAPDLRSGEPVAIMCDLSRAWDQLGAKQQVAVKAVVQVGGDFVAAASLLGYSTPKSARDTFNRAVADLTDRMNGETRKRAANYEGTGTREVLSNGQAIHLTGRDF